MTLRVNRLRTNTLDTITATGMTIGASAGTIFIGTVSTLTNLGSLTNYGTLKSSTYNTDLQINTITIADLQNYQYFISGFSSTNPATVNDAITFNLPTPTADIEGIVYTFRKIRGAISSSGSNFLFNFDSSVYVTNQTGITTTGQPVAVFTTSALNVRFVVVGYVGVYYWILA